MTLQKRECLLIELIHHFINRSVRRVFENDQFRVWNFVGHRGGKASRSDHVVTSKRDLRWCGDLADVRLDVVRDDCIRMLYERVDRLRRT